MYTYVVTKIIAVNDSSFSFFNDTAPTEIYTLSLHDALPIFRAFLADDREEDLFECGLTSFLGRDSCRSSSRRSEEHTSELQSQFHLVCRLLLEKKKPSASVEISSAGAARERSQL